MSSRLETTARWLATRHGVVVALVVVWSLHLTANAVHVIGDERGTELADSANQLDYVYQHVSGARNAGPRALWDELRAASVEWPPLAHFVLGVPGAMADASLAAVRIYNMLFFAVLLIGVYWCGRQAAGSAAGLLAAVLCSLMPAIYGASRQIGLDFPAAAMVALATGALMQATGFERPGRAAAAGLASGLAALARGQSLFFLVGTGAVELWRGLRGRARRVQVVLYAGLCGALVVVVSALWWWGKLGLILDTLRIHGDAGRLPLEGDPSLWGGIALYLGGLYRLTGLPLLVLLLAGVPGGLRLAGARRWDLLAWLLVPLLIHVALVVRNLRYVLPLLPVLPLLGSIGVLGWRERRARRAAVLALLLAGAVPWLLSVRHHDSLRDGLGRAAPLILGDRELNRPAGPDEVARAGAELAARLRPVASRGVALLMLRFERSRRYEETQMALSAQIRGHLPRLVVAHSGRRPTAWEERAMERATSRFVLVVKEAHRPVAARRLLAEVSPTGGALQLWELQPGSSWRPPLGP